MDHTTSNHNENWVGYPVKALGALALIAGACIGTGAYVHSSAVAQSQGQTAPGGFNSIVTVRVPFNFLK